MIKEFKIPYPHYIHNEGEAYRKKLQILNIKLSRTESVFGVLVGHNLFQDEIETYFLVVYRRISEHDWKMLKPVKLPPQLRFVSH